MAKLDSIYSQNHRELTCTRA